MLHSLHWLPIEKRIKYKSLIKTPHVLQTIFTFTLLPSSSTVLQTPEHSEYCLASTLGPVVSTLSLTRLQPPGTNSLFLPSMRPLLVLSDLPGKLSFRNLFFSPITLRYESERERVSVYVRVCVGWGGVLNLCCQCMYAQEDQYGSGTVWTVIVIITIVQPYQPPGLGSHRDNSINSVFIALSESWLRSSN